ncbi:unnamed protein product [Lathyrus sativus]|nr:unnamed protein product [Lathyrus sativus]
MEFKHFHFSLHLILPPSHYFLRRSHSICWLPKRNFSVFNIWFAVEDGPTVRKNSRHKKKELWKVVVRIHHKWSIVSNNKQQMELIVVVSQGDDIHVVVPTMLVDIFSDKLIVGHTYTISNFKIHANDIVFKPSSHRYMVKFIGGTSVNDVDKHEIPAKSANFTSFSDIMTGQYRKDLLLGEP